MSAPAAPPVRVVGPLSQIDVLRFAGACGDFNPLHHDRDAAAGAGFGAPVVMGQMTAGIVAAWITDWCGVEHLLELEMRFVSPVLVGDVLTLEGSVSPDTDPASDVVLLSATALKGDTVVVRAQARAVLPGLGSGGAPAGA